MNLFVDTSVWSLALRRDQPPATPALAFLRQALEGEASVFTTGIVLQEILQGVRGPKSRETIVARFGALPFITPEIEDHVDAARLHTECRRKGLQVGTIDILLAHLCIRHQLTMLTADADFRRIAEVTDLSLWRS